MWRSLLLFFLLLHANGLGLFAQSTKALKTEILIAGGGASGTAAALQAARMGRKVILVEHTTWLGGMLTAAGVSAIDGNHKMPSGIWGEFRTQLEQHYGGPEALATGWVSNTQYEPAVGNQILNRMLDSYPQLNRIHGYFPVVVLKSGNVVQGVVFENALGEKLEVQAKITIDATELGDVLALAGCEHYIGQDPRSLTGEELAPMERQAANIQDLTYVAILKDYGTGKAPLVGKPVGYDLTDFECTCKEVCPDPANARHACAALITYGKLPNNKYMINWPLKGNDSYLNVIEMTQQERQKALQKAKTTTLAYVWFLQNRAGFTHLGLYNEFGSTDSLPFIPYHREARRVKGLQFFTMNDLLDPYAPGGKAFYKIGVAVGNYPIDHHHEENPAVSNENNYYQIPPFTVPYACLIPERMDGLIVAEKSISVSHMVNGCTRLQPVVLGIGQAAGAAAALAVKKGIQARQVAVAGLQEVLLAADAYVFPLTDVLPQDPAFRAIQRACVRGWLKAEPKAVDWANEMFFYPDKPVQQQELQALLDVLRPGYSVVEKGILTSSMIAKTFRESGLKVKKLATKKESITRKELALWLDRSLEK
ncbi:MAG: FAD-dependent oxidoreductase [Haliscomenobacter sp.]|nr:FAD-dependent oxidoreductase [Haliscomenobacter sp.]MBK9489371.1 FAD-dependent oxidoreductase [Haliscomenobacter sp.]